MIELCRADDITRQVRWCEKAFVSSRNARRNCGPFRDAERLDCRGRQLSDDDIRSQSMRSCRIGQAGLLSAPSRLPCLRASRLTGILRYITRESGNLDTGLRFVGQLRQQCAKLADFGYAWASRPSFVPISAAFPSRATYLFPLCWRCARDRECARRTSRYRKLLSDPESPTVAGARATSEAGLPPCPAFRPTRLPPLGSRGCAG